MRNIIWYGVCEICPGKEDCLETEFRREKDARAYMSAQEGKYPDRKYKLREWIQMDIWEWEETRKS